MLTYFSDKPTSSSKQNQPPNEPTQNTSSRAIGGHARHIALSRSISDSYILPPGWTGGPPSSGLRSSALSVGSSSSSSMDTPNTVFNSTWGVPFAPLVPEVPTTSDNSIRTPVPTSTSTTANIANITSSNLTPSSINHDYLSSTTSASDGAYTKLASTQSGVSYSSIISASPTQPQPQSTMSSQPISKRQSLLASQLIDQDEEDHNQYSLEAGISELNLNSVDNTSLSTSGRMDNILSMQQTSNSLFQQQHHQFLVPHHHQLPAHAEASKHPYDVEMNRRMNQVEPAADESKNTLVIKNLPFKFKQADLDKILSDNSARPKNVRLLRDDAGRFTGIAFVRCPSKDEAAKLILSMNGMDVGGRSIQVEFKKKKSKKKQMQQKLTASGHTMLSSSGDSLSSDDELLSSSSSSHHAALQPMMNNAAYDNAYPKRLSFSDESGGYERYVQQQSGVPSVYVPYQSMQHATPRQQQEPIQPPGKKLSISAEHNITDKYFQRKTPQFAPAPAPVYNALQQMHQQQQQSQPHQSYFSNSSYLTPQSIQPNYQQMYQQPYGQQQSHHAPGQHTNHLRLSAPHQSGYDNEHFEQQHRYPNPPPGYHGPPGIPRRKSMSQLEGITGSSYHRATAARSLTHSAENENNNSVIRPVRQPLGPDGRSKGFYQEYQSSRSTSPPGLEQSNAFVQ